MDTWQIIVSTCAGLVTILTVSDKLGITGKLKKADMGINEVEKIIKNITEFSNQQQQLVNLQKDQNGALLAILRNELYRSFRMNRELGVWTDDECFVQTKLHEAYKNLHGNGEEEIWWEKKKHWNIVTHDEYDELMRNKNTNIKLKENDKHGQNDSKRVF